MTRMSKCPEETRLAVAGIPWHIIQRGNNHSPFFLARKDYFYYLDHLQRQSLKFECAMHAYCLMKNHVHLLITPESVDSASLMMKHLGQRFAQYINRSYQRSGTLWEGRFKSCLAQDESYALTCYRLIPKPRVNLTHYHGILAPNHRWRGLVTAARSGKGV